MHAKLFGGKDSVLMSELATKFYPVISEVTGDLYQGLSQRRVLRRQPSHGPGHVSGSRFACPRPRAGPLRPDPVRDDRPGLHRADSRSRASCRRSSSIVTSRVMPRKTQKGRIAWEQISGLEEYIRRAEVEDIQAQDRRGIFERLLPYAIIFGLSNRWAQAFADLYTQPPDWYQPVDPLNYSMMRFTGRYRPLDLVDE